MRKTPSSPGTRAILTAFLLAAFALRALIPAGYMPSADRPFQLEICPTGFPAHLLSDTSGGNHHDGHTGSHNGDGSGFKHCVFGSATASGPAPQLPSLVVLHVQLSEPSVSLPLPIVTVRRFQIQQPRAPPFFS